MLTALAGWMASYGVLRKKPLEILRGSGVRKSEIGRILHLKSEIRNLRMDIADLRDLRVHSEISDFGFEMQDSLQFQISRTIRLAHGILYNACCECLVPSPA